MSDRVRYFDQQIEGTTWLPATWDDVRPGTIIRRDIGEMGEVESIERRPHRHGHSLRVELLTREGEWKALSISCPTNHVWVAVPAT